MLSKFALGVANKFQNLIRQYTYRDVYDYSALPAWDKSPAKLLSHIEHCIEMLRVDIMCIADDTPYLVEIRSNSEEIPRHDAFIHRCRNFEKLIDWANEHVVEPYNATQELIKHKDEHFDQNNTAHF